MSLQSVEYETSKFRVKIERENRKQEYEEITENKEKVLIQFGLICAWINKARRCSS